MRRLRLAAGATEKGIENIWGLRVLRAASDAAYSVDGDSRTIDALGIYRSAPDRPWTTLDLDAGSGVLSVELFQSEGEAMVAAPPAGVVRLVDNEGVPIIGGTGSPVPVVITDPVTGYQANNITSGGSIRTDIQSLAGRTAVVDPNALPATPPVSYSLLITPHGRDPTGQGRPNLCGTDGALVASAHRDWMTLGSLASLAAGVVQGTYNLDGYDQCAVMFWNYSAGAISPALYAITPDGPFTAGMQFWSAAIAASYVQHVVMQAGNGYSGALVEGIPYVPHKVMVNLPVTGANDDMKAQILVR